MEFIKEKERKIQKRNTSILELHFSKSKGTSKNLNKGISPRNKPTDGNQLLSQLKKALVRRYVSSNNAAHLFGQKDKKDRSRRSSKRHLGIKDSEKLEKNSRSMSRKRITRKITSKHSTHEKKPTSIKVPNSDLQVAQENSSPDGQLNHVSEIDSQNDVSPLPRQRTI